MIVHRYGLLAPTVGADIVMGQLRLAHIYRNLLTEIERERRKALGSLVEQGIEEASAVYAAAIKTLEELRAELRRERVKGRSRRVEASALKTVIDAAKRDKNEALQMYKAARRESLARLRVERDRIDGLALELVKGARATCNVYWGTYLLCEDAVTRAAKAPLFDGETIHLPRFLRWTGEGRLGVQVQKGMELGELENSAETRLQIVSQTKSRRGETWNAKRSPWGKTLRMRVGSSETGRPVFAEWPMKMHRALPVHARIKRATVTRALIGPREEWSLTITLDTTLSAPRYPVPRNESAVAVDLGWRAFGENGTTEIRVCAYGDNHGRGSELRLSSHDVHGLMKANELRGVRDKEMEIFKKKLEEWRTSLVSKRTSRKGVAAFLERSNHLWSWRAQSRFVMLVRWWKENRLTDDDAIFLEAQAWIRQDRHLWAWECSQRTGALRHRKDTYRVFARKLAQTYEWLVLEDFNIAEKIARVPELEEDDTEQGERARSYRQLASPSELRLALIQAFGSERVRVIQGVSGRTVITDSAFTTCTCHVCGLVERFDAAKHLEHQCGGCGTKWDQDYNAWRNLIERWRIVHDGENARIDNVAKYEGSWQKVKRKKKEREESNEPLA
jgi:hypothetical protein